MKALIAVGISCSGKTTLADELVKQGWADVNRDWIRFNVVCPGSDWSTYKFTKKRELDVTSEQEQMVIAAAQKGKNVIISDTNLNSDTRSKWVAFCEELGYEVEILPMPVSLEEAWKRDAHRANGVGSQVIYKQWQKWLEFTDRKRYAPDATQPKAIMVDVDGTLADMSSCGRSPYDWHRVGEDDTRDLVVDIVEGLSLTHQIIVVSGRDGVCYDETERWLVRNAIPYDALFMRECGDSRKDTIIKEEIFWNFIADHWNVVGVIEDRPCMVRLWNDIGIPNVIAVADQNIEF